MGLPERSLFKICGSWCIWDELCQFFVDWVKPHQRWCVMTFQKLLNPFLTGFSYFLLNILSNIGDWNPSQKQTRAGFVLRTSDTEKLQRTKCTVKEEL